MLALVSGAVGDTAAEERQRPIPPEFEHYMRDVTVRAVRDEDGRPIAGIRLVIDGGNEVFGRWKKTLRTGPNGLARTRLPVGDYSVYPLADELALISRRFSVHDAAPTFEARLQRSCRVSGRVVDEHGAPIAGSGVEVWADQGPYNLTTDADGAFSVGRLSAAEHSVTATAPGFAPVTARVTLRAGEHRRSFDVVLRRGATLAAKAVCGGPCVGAHVTVSFPDDFAAGEVGPDGQLRLRELPAGDVTVRAVRNEDLPGEVTSTERKARLQAGQTWSVNLALTPTGTGAALRGSVVDAAGKPLFAAIWVTCPRGKRHAVSEAKDGAFVVNDVPHGPCTVTASKDDQRASLDVRDPVRHGPLRLAIR